MVAGAELTLGQPAKPTTALYRVVTVRLLNGCTKPVLTILLVVTKLSVDDSQRIILPEEPVKKSVPKLPEAHSDLLPETVPAVKVATVTVAGAELLALQAPF